MRLRKYIAFAGMAVLMLCSCNEMENAPTNKFTDNSYWTSTTKAQYVVNMAYSQMYNAGRMWSDESLSDNAYDGRSVDDQRAIRKGMATPSLDIFKNEWKDLYGGIKTCHVFLEKVDLVPNMDASVKARMIAEIRYIRASLYFRLTNPLWCSTFLYGGHHAGRIAECKSYRPRNHYQLHSPRIGRHQGCASHSRPIARRRQGQNY